MCKVEHPLLSRARRSIYGHVCALGRVDDAVSGEKSLAGKGLDSFFELTWLARFVIYFVRCKFPKLPMYFG